MKVDTTEWDPRSSHSTTVYRVGVVAVLGLLLFPLVTERFAPLVDFPNHLARVYVLRHYADVPAFSEWFSRSAQPVPNSALDATLVLLQGATDVLRAGQIFLIGVVLTWALGVHALVRVTLGRTSLVALPCMTLVYNSAWLYGFVNYVMGVSLFMLAFAAWLRARRERRMRWTLLVVVLSTLTYLAHLSGLVILGIAMAATFSLEWVRGQRPTTRQLLVDGAPLLPPLALFVGFMDGEGSTATIRWTASSKAVGLLSYLRTYDSAVDVVVASMLVLAIVILVRERANIRFDPRLAGAALALFVTFLLSPWEAMTGTAVDQRFMPPAMLLGILALRHTLRERTRRALIALAFFMCGLRVGDMWYRWEQLQSPLADAWALASQVPRQARVYPLYFPPTDLDAAKVDRALLHAPLFAVITSHAYLPTLLAVRGTHALIYRTPPRYREPRRDGSIPRLPSYHVVWRRGPVDDRIIRFLEECCPPIRQQGPFELRVARSASEGRGATRPPESDDNTVRPPG